MKDFGFGALYLLRVKRDRKKWYNLAEDILIPTHRRYLFKLSIYWFRDGLVLEILRSSVVSSYALLVYATIAATCNARMTQCIFSCMNL